MLVAFPSISLLKMSHRLCICDKTSLWKLWNPLSLLCARLAVNLSDVDAVETVLWTETQDGFQLPTERRQGRRSSSRRFNGVLKHNLKKRRQRKMTQVHLLRVLSAEICQSCHHRGTRHHSCLRWLTQSIDSTFIIFFTSELFKIQTLSTFNLLLTGRGVKAHAGMAVCITHVWERGLCKPERWEILQL